MSRMRALCLWSRENKVGLESLSNVPRNSRFEGALTPVMFSGDKKYYPAKIIMISDDNNALELKLQQVEAEIEKAKQELTVSASGNMRRKRTATKVVDPGAASVRAIDVATGAKPSIPKELEAAHSKVQVENKKAKESLRRAQLSQERNVLASVKKSLFRSENDKNGSENAPEGEEEDDAESDENDEEPEDNDKTEKGDLAEDEAEWKWCGCKPCQVLQKFDSPVYHNMFKELHGLLSKKTSSGKPKYLELLPIPSLVKQVELSAGTNVFIAASEKDQLKVDYRNKPGALAKETLFVLFGREVFQTLNVTALGQKEGTYAISENVKKAIAAFINRNVDKEKRLTTKNFNALINKRAPEWRRTPSPKQAKTTKKSKMNDQVVSVSPFRCVPSSLDTLTPVKTPLKSSGKTPSPSRYKSPLEHWHSKSPYKSPRKSPHRKSPVKKSPKKIALVTPSPLKKQDSSVRGNQEPPSTIASPEPRNYVQLNSMNYGLPAVPRPYPGQPQDWGYQSYSHFNDGVASTSYMPQQDYTWNFSQSGAPVTASTAPGFSQELPWGP